MPRISVAVDQESWDNKFITLPPGEYTLRYETANPGKSKVKGSPQLECTLAIIQPQVAVVEGKEVNISKQKVFDTVSLVPKAAGFLRDRLVGAGVSFSKNGELIEFDPTEFIGKQVVAKIEVEVGTDKVERNRIKSTRPLV